MSWRDEEITANQLQLISVIQEFCLFSVPKFDGKTKGEASDYIDKYARLAFDNANSPKYGDGV